MVRTFKECVVVAKEATAHCFSQDVKITEPDAGGGESFLFLYDFNQLYR